MSIKFNSQACIKALEFNLVQAMEQLQEQVYSESVQNMQTAEGKKSLYKDEIQVVANVISASVVGGAYAAMDEYGKGSLMDPGNPFLDAYRNSSIWNPHRNDLTIRSRARSDGPYTNILGETKTSKSNVGGINLEEKGGIYESKPPSHAMQTAMSWLKKTRFKKVIQKVIENFDFDKFIIVDGR